MRLASPIPCRAAVVFLLTAGVVQQSGAHSDPWGDIHPRVEVVDGKFAITFTSQVRGDTDDYSSTDALQRMVFTPEGELVAPRHPLKRRRWHGVTGPVGLYGRRIPFGFETIVFQGRSEQPGYVIQSTDRTLTEVRLPWPKDTRLKLFEDALPTPEGMAITGKEDELNLKFYWFEHESTEPPTELMIGLTAMIYHFPVASNLAYAGGRFWLGYMKPTDDKGLELALWSWKPGEAEGRVELLDSPAHWNSHLSLAAIGDRLCLAYHCELFEKNRGRNAKIITVFRKAK